VPFTVYNLHTCKQAKTRAHTHEHTGRTDYCCCLRSNISYIHTMNLLSHLYTRVHVRMQRMHLHIFTFAYSCSALTHTHTHTHTHTQTHIYIYTHDCILMQCMYSHTHTYTHVCVLMQCMYSRGDAVTEKDASVGLCNHHLTACGVYG